MFIPDKVDVIIAIKTVLTVAIGICTYFIVDVHTDFKQAVEITYSNKEAIAVNKEVVGIIQRDLKSLNDKLDWIIREIRK